MARITVIGAAGFVGRHVVPLLLAEGHEIKTLDRHPSSEGRIEAVPGDVRDPDTVRDALKDCETVVHLAAGMSTENGMKEIVTGGTQNVVTAAREASVQRIIFMSCLGAEAASTSPFFVAKWRAEQLVRSSELPFTILRPSLVVGRGDGVLEPLARLIKTLPIVPIAGGREVRFQPIDVEDLARCVQISIGSDDLQGESVSVGGPLFMTLRQLVDLVSDHLGVSKPKVLVPDASLAALSQILPSSMRVLFQEPRIEQLRSGVVASPGIVDRMFGFEPRSIVSRLAEYLV
jgi:nucleoside-diphosphate-sugar epimerase